MVIVFASLALLFSLVRDASAECESFGVDYQDGGSYFQNIDLDETFTAFQSFSGCTSDSAHNILVSPNGDQSECSRTPMQPFNASQLVTCSQWTNQNLYTGDWSLMVISNNGDANPIAYQRDFHLSVGKPENTVTVSGLSSTVTELATSTTYTPTTLTRTTTSYLINLFAKAAATTSAAAAPIAAAASPTTKSHLIQTTLVVHLRDEEAKPSPAAYATPAVPPKADPMAKIMPTILGEQLNSVAASVISAAQCTSEEKKRSAAPTGVSHSAKFRKALLEGQAVPDDVRRAFVKERAANLAKRHPDSNTTTVREGGAVTTFTSYVATATAASTLYTTTTKVLLLGL